LGNKVALVAHGSKEGASAAAAADVGLSIALDHGNATDNPRACLRASRIKLRGMVRPDFMLQLVTGLIRPDERVEVGNHRSRQVRRSRVTVDFSRCSAHE
jgi:hypothetical protein